MSKRQSMPVLLTLLTEAAKAHGVYERTELAGQYDENWPEWYARHMARSLTDLGLEITENQTALPPTTEQAPA